ncbi:ribulokinase [Thalassobacillus sp. CUG 92003]|uniref:ribulokinase n=1 Tax=Thalassobacillus sp. CUG 92003 TaxID=2736641 RepID=UPI0015E761D6|nr:ribulokinase [Thalassobacillus sp. CUG 92003]
MDTYTLGIDFGTKSVRAILLNSLNGNLKAISDVAYPHGVITSKLPNSAVPLEKGWALQHPQDYVDCLVEAVTECLEEAEVDRSEVVGMGIDFTASTILPIDSSGMPLCLRTEWAENKHSWVKLWKHHAAYQEKEEINQVAHQTNQSFLSNYGGEISEEWMLPKVLQILKEAPEVYEAADAFIEAGDWVVFQLTGNLIRSTCMAGYKGLWDYEEGFPDPAFLEQVHPDLKHFFRDKMAGTIQAPGDRAGTLHKALAERLGLSEYVVVSTAIIDAHASVIGSGIKDEQAMLSVMGTSLCQMILSDVKKPAPGIGGVVKDGILPGRFAYETGQASGGDVFEWFIDNMVPESLMAEAESEGISIYQLLTREAGQLSPGESGLVALDWWNGNRSTLKKPELSGTIVGLTVDTKPEEIFRALMEALAFGTRKIVEVLAESGISITTFYNSGGLAEKNEVLMQIYADVIGRPMNVIKTPHTSARGAAILGAVAAGPENGGWEGFTSGLDSLGTVDYKVFEPREANHRIYEELYAFYDDLYESFGKGADMMGRLRSLQQTHTGERIT